MTAAPAPPTCEEEAAELLPCRGKGCGGGLHFAKCPTYYIDVVAAALRARQMAGRREAVEWHENAEKDYRQMAEDHANVDTSVLYSRIANVHSNSTTAIAALPEVP